MSTYENNNADTHTYEEVKVNKKASKKSNTFITLCLVAALIGCLMFSFIFDIKNITVEGNETLDANAIKLQSKLIAGENILKADTEKAKENLLKNPWIDTVQVTRIFPDTIKITVSECKKIAYIKFASNALAIDKTGKILEVIPLANATDFPVFSGITLSDTSPGEIISSEGNEEGINVVYELIRCLSETDLPKEIASIDIDKFHNASMILKNNMTVILGKGNLEYKVAYLEVAYPSNLSHKSGGKFDLSDTNKVILTG